MTKIFEPRAQIRVKDLSELNISELLNETYTTTPIHADKKTADGAVVTVNELSINNYTMTLNQTFQFALTVQFNTERRLIAKSSARTSNYCRADVPNLQAICSSRSRRIRSIDHDHNHVAAITDSSV